MVKKSVKNTAKKNAPVVQKPAAPAAAPMISNEQYTLNVMTSRCKSLETQVLALAQEVARLKSLYEPTAAKGGKDGSK